MVHRLGFQMAFPMKTPPHLPTPDRARVQLPTTPGLGCAQLGNLFAAMSDRDAMELLESAWEAGVRYFDTAPHYGLGLSEQRLGLFLQGMPRSEFLVSTKVGRLLIPTPHRRNFLDDEGFIVPASYRREWDFSAGGVRGSLEASHDRLGLDRIDIALIHDPQDHAEQALNDAASALEAMRSDGTVGAWGVGTRDTELLVRFARETAVDVVMLAGRFTLLTHVEALTLMDLCEKSGIAVINAGVFNSGILATDTPDPGAHFEYGRVPATILERAREIADVCARHGIPLVQAAFAFATSHSAVASVVLGADTSLQATGNARLAELPRPDTALWDDLANSGLLAWVPKL